MYSVDGSVLGALVSIHDTNSRNVRGSGVPPPECGARVHGDVAPSSPEPNIFIRRMLGIRVVKLFRAFPCLDFLPLRRNIALDLAWLLLRPCCKFDSAVSEYLPDAVSITDLTNFVTMRLR